MSPTDNDRLLTIRVNFLLILNKNLLNILLLLYCIIILSLFFKINKYSFIGNILFTPL